MSLKLSYRDKVIFIVVIVIVVLVGGFFLCVKSKIQESQDVKVTLQQKEQERDEIQAKIDTLEPLKQQLKDDIKAVDELQECFLDEKETYEADQLVYEIVSKVENFDEDFVLKSMTLTGKDAEEIEQYFYTRNNVAYDIKINSDLTGDSLPQEVYEAYYETESEPAEGVTLSLDTVELTYVVEGNENGEAYFETYFKPINELSSYDKTVNVRTIEAGSTSTEEDDAGVKKTTQELVVTVDIYSIQKMDTSKVE